jgi:hypothetical protein
VVTWSGRSSEGHQSIIRVLIRGNPSKSIAISAHPDERILDAVDQQPLEDSEVDQVLQRDEHDRREAVLGQIEEDLIGEATSR